MPQALSSCCALHSSISLQLDLYNYLQGYAMRAARDEPAQTEEKSRRGPGPCLVPAWPQRYELHFSRQTPFTSVYLRWECVPSILQT